MLLYCMLGNYEFSADMWSIGVVMFVMLFGYPPFSADTDDMIFQKILAGFQCVTKSGYGAHFPIDLPCSDSAKDLLCQLLTSNTAARLTADEALLHPWLLGETCSTETISSIVLDNLRSFSANTKLKSHLLQIMSSKLSSNDLLSIKKQFEIIDTNHDGMIQLSELRNILQRDCATISDDELNEIWHNADIDGDGVLKYNELVQLSVHHRLMSKRERLYELFNKIDMDGNGLISVHELQHVLEYSHEDAIDAINEIDTNHDGQICFDEFVQIWTNKQIKSIESKLNIELSPTAKYNKLSDEQCKQLYDEQTNNANIDQHKKYSISKHDCIIQ